MREENLALVKRAYEAFAAGDLETIKGMTAEDAVWRLPGWHTTFAPEYKGVEGVAEYLTKLFELTEGTIKVVPTAFFADEEHVVVLEHMTATRMGRLLETEVVHVFAVHGGKVYEATEFAAEPRKLEEFWV